MKKLFPVILLLLYMACASASQQKDVLYSLAKNYAVEMWNQGKKGNPALPMDRKAYAFYFKHLFDTYSSVFKTAQQGADSNRTLELYYKVCDLLKWKFDNKEYSHYKKYLKLKQQIEKAVLVGKD